MSKQNQEAFSKYIQIVGLTYIIFAGISSLIFTIYFNLKYEITDAIKFLLTLFFNQLSYMLGIGVALLAIDNPVIENSRKVKNNGKINEDYSMINSLYNKRKLYTLEVICGISGISLLIVSTKIEEWIKSYGVNIQDITLFNSINRILITFGLSLLVTFLILSMRRKYKYKRKQLKSK
ncbi:hypothetical protein [Sedimentibacter sp.]|uniref:hypothetical protein n=1 Tax=Sedimentibacter sp. TaxID=1960295 RepID=UPI0028A734BB|nr:hypothetical protein [Sedimentibacter sp.]